MECWNHMCAKSTWQSTSCNSKDCSGSPPVSTSVRTCTVGQGSVWAQDSIAPAQGVQAWVSIQASILATGLRLSPTYDIRTADLCLLSARGHSSPGSCLHSLLCGHIRQFSQQLLFFFPSRRMDSLNASSVTSQRKLRHLLKQVWLILDNLSKSNVPYNIT